jgi:hypothetical protein
LKFPSDVGTAHARIKVEAVGNIFFDVSSTDFSIIGKQSITFGPIADRPLGSPDFDPGATASSGLPVTYTTTGSCTVAGGLIHLTSVGACHVTAHQAGNAVWMPADDVTRQFNVTR